MIRQSIEQAFRFLGDAANAALLAVFAMATVKLYGLAGHYLAAAGGWPHPSLAYLEQVVLAPDARERILAWLAAWFCLVAAAGCAWMTILGLRWAYHALLRVISA